MSSSQAGGRRAGLNCGLNCGLLSCKLRNLNFNMGKNYPQECDILRASIVRPRNYHTTAVQDARKR